MGIRSDLQNQLRKLLNSDIIKGKVSVQRAYADWRRYPQYIVPLSEASIDLIFAPAFGANKKNATDIRLAIDALELIFIRPEIGVFILLSGDSDFSALVLKLKEYGKYVIGVGIRESSSDLLIQNCDEYYSYSEITGLSKEGVIEHTRKDPWALTVEAARQMQSEGDVMRSDRLKQVMQSLDPNFDERDVGFNKFSKFVVAAGQRGLLKLNKMNNGQFAVELGANANVPTAEAAGMEAREVADHASANAQKQRSHRPVQQAATTHLTLSESFELLRQALMVLEAVGGQSTDGERVRSKMMELLDTEDDPAFDPRRFPRLLRQAHDAGLIDLIKSGDNDYLLKLSDSEMAVVEEGSTEEKVDSKAAEVAAGESGDKAAKKARATKRRKKSAPRPDAEPDAKKGSGGAEAFEEKAANKKRTPKRRKSPGRSTRERDLEAAKPDERASRAEAEDAASARSPQSPPGSRARNETKGADSEGAARRHTERNAAVFGPEVPKDRATATSTGKRNPRYRRGSRGGSPRVRPGAEGQDTSDSDATGRTPVSAPPVEGRRSLGLRKGSKGGTPPSAPPGTATDARPGAANQPPEEPPKRSVVHEPAPSAHAPVPQLHNEAVEGGGFFRRITAVFQRAVQGPNSDGGDGAESG